MMIASRRSLLTGLGALLATTALVRAGAPVDPRAEFAPLNAGDFIGIDFGTQDATSVWLVRWGEPIYPQPDWLLTVGDIVKAPPAA